MPTEIPSGLIPESAVDHDKVATGIPVQFAYAQSSALVTGTTVLPNDNTIPQNNEGVAVPALDTAFTPKSATNLLVIDVLINAGHSAANVNVIAALFVDTTADALAATAWTQVSGGSHGLIRLRHVVVAGSTSERTYKARIGGHVAGTVTVNGQSAAAIFGGVLLSSMTVTEYKA